MLRREKTYLVVFLIILLAICLFAWWRSERRPVVYGGSPHGAIIVDGSGPELTRAMKEALKP